MDLLDISQAPNMGTDFDRLAQLGGPEGNINDMGGVLYGMSLGRKNQFLMQAAKSAQLQAMMKAQQAGEYMQGAPGRSARIDLGNAGAQDDLANKDNILGKRRSDIDVGRGKNEVELMRQALKKNEEFINMWDKAKSPEEKNIVQEMMRSEGATFGKLRLGELPPERADMVMKALRQAQVNDAKQAQVEATNASKEKIAAGHDATTRYVADSRERLGKALEAARSRIAADKRPLLESILTKVKDGEEISDEEIQVANILLSIKSQAAEVRGAGLPGTIDFKDGKVVRTPAKLPEPPRLKKEAPNGGEADGMAAPPKRIANKAEYDKLPSGTAYIDPRDNKPYKKP